MHKVLSVVGPDIIDNWVVVDQNIICGFRPKPKKSNSKWNKLNIPKIVLTNCEGKDTHITRIYTKKTNEPRPN